MTIPESTEPEPAAPAEPSGLWRRRGVRIVACVAAGLLSVGAGLGITSAIRPSAASQIPSPPPGNQTFTEDFNGVGQDNQTNAVQVSAPGVVSVLAAGKPVASGAVITSSGYVLTSDTGLRGALAVRFAMSGKTYRATKVGSDDIANLALLKLTDGGQYPAVKLGNSDDARLTDTVNDAGANGTTKGLMLSTGEITGINLPAVIGGHRLTGLLEVSSLDAPQEIGGPLLTLNAEVLGIAVGTGPRTAYGDAYVVPINAALSIAKQILG